MQAVKNLIWSDEDLDYEDYREFIEAEYPDIPENSQKELMYDLNAEQLCDERINLDIPLNNPILVIADLGLWNGRKSGYKEIRQNIKECLYSDTDYTTWYLDKRGDLACRAIHHDGTNYYIYREYKDGISERQKDNLLNKIYYGVATRQDITRVTRSLGPYIRKVYGW